MFKRTIAAIMILATTLCLAVKADAAKPTQWLIYWYVCGTDIETTRIAFGTGTNLMSGDPNALKLAEPDRAPGDATRSIKEVDKATLSPDVKIFMQAGGTYVWGHEKFRDLNAKIDTGLGEASVIGKGNAFYRQWHLRKDVVEAQDKQGNNVKVRLYSPESKGKIGRYVYDKNHRNWHAREQLPITGDPNTPTDMGSKEGFISFLQAGQKLERELYPEGNVRRVLILKDHGSGSSVCSDEYTKNIIHVDKIKEAFVEVQGGWTNSEEKPFEVVLFDACLMSTYETAMALEDVANYMVASQEETFGKGNFSYNDLLNELSKNPAMSGKELGNIICNTGWKDTKVVDKDFGRNTNAVFTLSVIDLFEQKMNALKTAYANFSEKATRLAQKNSGDVVTFAKFKNAANISERYPSSNVFPKQWLVDLKNFTDNLEGTFPELKDVRDELVQSINNVVVYNKRGDVLSRGGGLSKQFPTDFYRVIQSSTRGKSVNLSGLANTTVEIDEEKKTASIELGEDDLKKVAGIRYRLLYLMPGDDSSEKLTAVYLGSDSDVDENRQAGTFKISFSGKKWVFLDAAPLWVEVVSDATRKNKNGKKIGGNDICVSRILLNGEDCKLFFSRSYPNGKITLIGVIPVTEDNVKETLPSGDLKSLKKGDVVTPLYVQKTDEQAAEFVRGNPITIGDKPKMELGALYNGIFLYAFEFVNPIDESKNVVLVDDAAVVKIKKGNIVKVKAGNDIDSLMDFDD